MKNSSRRIWITVLAVVVVVALGGAYLLFPHSGQAQSGPSGTPQVNYQTVKVQKADLASSIGTTGAIRANQSAILVWQTTGSIDTVNVKLGDPIEKDQVLAVLDPTSLPQNIILAQADLVTAQRALDDLKSSTSASSQAQLALVNAQKALDDAKQHRLNLSYRSTPDQIAAANANFIMAQNVVDDKQELYDRVSGRPENDNVRAFALADLENAKKARDKAQINLNWYKGKADPKDIAQADAAIAVAQSKLDDAQREWDRLKDGTDPNDIAAAEAHVQAIQATLKLARIAAPFAGTITVVNSKAGDQVTPGLQAFQLDDFSHLYVDVTVSQVDINDVKRGQPVSVVLDAIPEKQYQGTVTDVSTVGKNTSGTVSFVVTVEIAQKDADVHPGMTVTANITTGQPHQALLVPNRAVHTQNSNHYVYLLKGGQVTQLAVTLGTQSDANVEILSNNLHEGDLVILNPPAGGN